MVRKYIDTPNLSIKTSTGEIFAYRDLNSASNSIPLVLFNHLSGNLDNWDPRVIDRLAQHRHIITFDYSGVGGSNGKVPLSIKEMANNSLNFIHTLQLKKIDVLGFSMGGMVVQELLAIEPTLVRRVILAGTGPRGGSGIDQVTKISDHDLFKSILLHQDVKKYLFFTNSDNGRNKANAFLKQIHLRKQDRDKSISWSAYRRQLKAINSWGKDDKDDLSKITQPTLIANGISDKMVPIANSYDLNEQIPNSTLIVYPDAGHAGIFQNFQEFTASAEKLLNE